VGRGWNAYNIRELSEHFQQVVKIQSESEPAQSVPGTTSVGASQSTSSPPT